MPVKFIADKWQSQRDRSNLSASHAWQLDSRKGRLHRRRFIQCGKNSHDKLAGGLRSLVTEFNRVGGASN